MRTNLLLGAALVGTSLSALAGGVEIPGGFILGMSPDGKWAFSDDGFSAVVAINLENPDDPDYFLVSEDNGMDEMFAAGIGNAISNNGTLVGNLDGWTCEVPAYWQDGEIHVLPTAESDTYMNIPFGISADGNVICGIVGRTAAFAMDADGVMNVPVIWERDENGEFGMYTILPYPTKDMFGSTPQYSSAVSINKDGTKIAGQLYDDLGMICQPIVYTKNADGEWSYELLGTDFIAPDGNIPQSPGEPEYPQPEDFMTEEEYATWQAAYDAWVESGYSTPCPEPESYMTEEELAAYTDAQETYDALYEYYLDFLEEAYALLENGCFTPNQVLLSTNGEYLGLSLMQYDPWSYETVYTPAMMVLNEENPEVKIYESEVPVVPNWINSKGMMMGVRNRIMGDIWQCYILPSVDGEFISIEDYLQTASPSAYDWMKDNMTHEWTDYEQVYDEEYDYWDWTVVEKESILSGMGFASDDMSVLSFTVQNQWDFSDMAPYYYSYIISNTGISTGFNAVQAENVKVGLALDGTLSINGDALSVEIFDLNGRRIYSAAAANGNIATGLSTGAYIVRVTTNEGVKVVKAIVK